MNRLAFYLASSSVDKGVSSLTMIGGDVRILLATGICGFSAFSAFRAETFVLVRDGHILLAIAYVSFSVMLGVAATISELWFVKAT